MFTLIPFIPVTNPVKLLTQAFECRLCEVRPVYGEWDEEANELFKNLTMDKKLVARVSSLYFIYWLIH